jgi:phenylacetic acid degradation protein paaN
MPNATLTDLVDTHAELLSQAQAVAKTREYWSAFPESPSPRVYGETAAAEGEQAFQALLGSTFDLGQPNDGTTVGEERSPYGFDLNVGYPHATPDQVLEAAGAALPAWRAATPAQRAAVGAEILTRINARSFELAHAVMHTSGQAFVMAFQAGGPHAQDRGLEAVAYALAEQERHASSALWVKPQGKRPPLRMVKEFTPVSRGIALVIGCNTFPTWNSYPGLFASLVTGNCVVVKPHPRGVLPLALSVSIAREVLAETGFDPNVVTLAVEAPTSGSPPTWRPTRGSPSSTSPAPPTSASGWRTTPARRWSTPRRPASTASSWSRPTTTAARWPTSPSR